MKMILTLLGVVFVVIGLLGFVNDPLLGIFEVDVTHNVVHVLSGLLALAAVGMGEGAMRLYARTFGVVYGLVGVVGFVMAGDMLLGLMTTNLPDDLLHVGLAAVLLYAGFALKDEGMPLSEPMA